MKSLISGVTSKRDIQKISAALLAASRPSSDPAGHRRPVLDLDLDTPWRSASPKAHVDQLTAVLLASLLLSPAARDVDVRVRLPHSQRALHQLARGGLLFALANRDEARTKVHFTTGTENQLPLFDVTGMLRELEPWRRNWRPADRAFRRAMHATAATRPLEIDERLSGATSVIGTNFVTFINPHKSSATGIQRELTANLAVPWLAQMLHGDANRQMLADVAEILDETLANINEHAFSAATPHKSSAVQLYVTETHTRGQSHTVHLLVLDTGMGIPASLRPKIPHLADSDDEEVLEFSVSRSRQDRYYGRARGNALPDLCDMAVRNQGKLTIATSGRAQQSTLLTVDPEGTKVETLAATPIAGTIVLATIPVFVHARMRRGKSTQGETRPAPDRLPVGVGG